MSNTEEEMSRALAEIMESIRLLVRDDPKALRRLIDEICSEGSGCSPSRATFEDAVSLALRLGYPTWELLEAVASLGIVRTVTFLRRESAQLSVKPISDWIM